MKHMKWLFIMLILLVAGCAGEVEELPEEPKQTEEVTIMEAGGWSETGGGFLMELSNTDGAECLVYFDYATKLLVPFCTKADCSHNVTNTEAKTCTAAILGVDCSSYCGIYGGKLWYLKVLDLEHTAVYCADVTGENAQEMFVIDFFPFMGDIILYDNTMYATCKRIIENEYGVLTGDAESLVAISLEDGSKTVLLPETENIGPSYYTIGFYDGKVYYRYFPCMEFPKGRVCYYDCKTGETGVVPLADVTIDLGDMYERYIVYKGEEKGKNFVEVFDLKQEKVVEKIKFNNEVSTIRVYRDEVMLIVENEGYYQYTFSDGELKHIGDMDLTKEYWAFWSTEDGYLVKTNEDDMISEIGYISREEYENAGMPKLLTENQMPIW